MKKLDFKTIVRRLLKIQLPQADMVIGISSGGVVPASLVAYRTGVSLQLMKVRFRNAGNEIIFNEPEVEYSPCLPEWVETLLLVDDVSVTGATLDTAKKCYEGLNIMTMVFKGKADYVLFPEIEDCVVWPWHSLRQT